MPEALASFQIEQAFREGSGRAVATLTRKFGDLDVAEEAVQQAFLAALSTWPERGVPPNPVAWIVTTAKHVAIDRLRRESTRDERQGQSLELFPHDPEPDDEKVMIDDQLRLIFTCCHPALAPGAQVALTLRMVAGLSTPQIARAFLVSETTMQQRIVRAKNKIRAANIPYRAPEREALPSRMRWVLAVIYLVFNEGYVASSGDELVRRELCSEAIRLARLVRELVPDQPEADGLLALLLLIHSRHAARTSSDGSLVRLGEQDRGLWDRALMAEGYDIVCACLERNEPGPYQIQAAINAVHAQATNAAETDWPQIVTLYDQLMTISPSPVVALNRAIAIGEARSPQEALAAIDSLELPDYHLYHAARADLLARLGQNEAARAAYDRALPLTENRAERELLMRRRDGLNRARVLH